MHGKAPKKYVISLQRVEIMETVLRSISRRDR